MNEKYIINRFSIVYMMQLPQNINTQKMMEELVDTFSELKGSVFESLPSVPDKDFPIIATNDDRLNVAITPTRYMFNFRADNFEFKNIYDKVVKTYKFIEKTFIGQYRLGIIIDGQFNNENAYNKYVKDMYGMDIGDDLVETQYCVRKIVSSNIKGIELKANLWNRCRYDTEGNISNIMLDINTHVSSTIKNTDITPIDLYKKFYENKIRECIVYDEFD